MGLLPCQELLNRCVNLLDAYDDFNTSGDNNNNVEEMLESLNSLDRADQVFITEVFLGCSEFSKLLSLIIDDYNEHEKSALLSDRTLLRIFTYLVTFRIQDLTLDGLSEFILQMSQAERVIQFLKFYLDEQKLASHVSTKWCEICDDDFIDDQLTLLKRALNDLHNVCNRVEVVLKSAKKTKKTSRRDYRCFGDEVLTLKPMMIREEGIWNLFLGEGKAEKDEIVKLNVWKKTFNHLVEGMELKIYNLDDNYNNNNNMNTNNQTSTGETACKSKSKVNVIRMNTAAILREGLLHKKKDEELMRKIDQWQSGSGDPMKYEEWQKKVKEEEDQKKYEMVEMSRLLGKLAQEQSILAKQQAMEVKKRNVEMMRIQAAVLMQEYLVTKLKEEEKMRLKRKKVTSMKKDSKEARKKMTELKAKAVQSMQEEMRELMRIALEEITEEEMKQRLEVIRKIRELEANRTVKSKVIDLTETSGCGLHTEMSISELRERLKQMQEEEAKRIEAKKNEIFLNKQMKEQMIQETLCSISRHRDEIAKAACTRQDEKKRATSVTRHKTPAILELERKFEELRMQRMSMGKSRCPTVDHTGTYVCTNIGPDDKSCCKQTTDKKSRVELLAI